MSDQEKIEEQVLEQKIEQRTNDNITVFFKTKPGCIIKMEVHISPKSQKASYEKALKELKKEITIPGFRKGKVPNDIVAKNFSRELEGHYQDLLKETSFHEAILLIQRPPFTVRSIRKSEMKQNEADGSTIAIFEYEAMPEVPEVDLKTIQIEKKEIKEPSEEDLRQIMTKHRLSHAAKTAVVDRQSIQEGDIATISLHAVEPTEKTLSLNNKDFYIIPNMTPDWIFSALLGMQIGEKKEIEYPGDTEKAEEIEKGPYILELHGIKTATLPEENDAFAAQCGASSLADLKEKIFTKAKNDLNYDLHELSKQEFKNELISKYAFDLPQSLIEGETEARFRAHLQFKRERGEQVQNQAEARSEFQEEVKRYFTCLFLMKRIASDMKPQFTQSEYIEEIFNQAVNVPFHEKIIYPGLSQEEIDLRILINLMIKKCCESCIKES